MLISLPIVEVAELCRKWQVVKLAMFGSSLGDAFGPDSDIDLLVTFGPEARWGLFAESRMADEFQSLLGRPVDLVDRRAVERSKNWIRRTEILSTATPVFTTQDASHAAR
jgi:predicted nucleotidyltransferase